MKLENLGICLCTDVIWLHFCLYSLSVSVGIYAEHRFYKDNLDLNI